MLVTRQTIEMEKRMQVEHPEEYRPPDDADSTFMLVSSLVTEMFLEKDEALIITAKSGKFFHDSKTSVEVADSAKVCISRAGFTETGFRTVVTISGTVESIRNERYTFSLYFIMKRKISVISRTGTQVGKLAGQCLTLSTTPPCNRLYDSLFILTLEISNCREDNRHFGEGQGYLVFGRYLQQELVLI